MDMPLNCESSPLSNLLPWIRACHYEEYEVIKIVLLVLASVLLACAVANFILLGYTVGWKNWNQNVRIKTQFIVCGLIVLGMHLRKRSSLSCLSSFRSCLLELINQKGECWLSISCGFGRQHIQVTWHVH
jgi:maltodextrin utilization protein YvdJ